MGFVLTGIAVELGDICTGDDVEALRPSGSSLVIGLGKLTEPVRGVCFGKAVVRRGIGGDGRAVIMLGTFCNAGCAVD
jgi:hypothetical protein